MIAPTPMRMKVAGRISDTNASDSPKASTKTMGAANSRCVRTKSRTAAARSCMLIASAHDRDAFGRAGDSRIKPAAAVFAERVGFVEQHDVVPLRALRFVHRERIAEIELV